MPFSDSPRRSSFTSPASGVISLTALSDMEIEDDSAPESILRMMAECESLVLREAPYGRTGAAAAASVPGTRDPRYRTVSGTIP